MLPLILVAIIATDIAVGVMFLAMRRQAATPSEALLDQSVAAEMEELVAQLRGQAEQAQAEMIRQKAQLRRLLTELESGRALPAPATSPRISQAVGNAVDAVASLGSISRRDVIRLAADGYSLRAIAARTSLSVEEVRLMLAMSNEAA